jgi:hypothetical protein
MTPLYMRQKARAAMFSEASNAAWFERCNIEISEDETRPI